MRYKNLIIIILPLVIVVPIVFFTLHAQDKTDVSLKKNYTVGYMKNLINEVDINDAQAAIKVLLNEILKTYNYDKGYYLKVKIYAQINELIKEMKQDSLAVLAINTYDYLTYNDKIGLDPALVPTYGDNVFIQYYLLVNKESNFKNITDLRGAKIGLVSSTNNIASRLWLDIMLAKENIPDKTKFFKNIIMSDKESQLILNLFFGQLDACIVTAGTFSLMKELNPQLGEKITVIQSSPNYLWGVMCFTKMVYNPEDRKLFYTNSMQIQKLNSGRQLFSLVKITKLEPFKNEYLNSFKDLLKEFTYFLKVKKIKNNEPN
jgi:phosphonate transport system substrate-binding protein